MGVEVIRKAEDAPKVTWYEFEDGVYSIHTATVAEGEDVVFRSRNDIWPSLTLFKMNINYTMCRNATPSEATGLIETLSESGIAFVKEIVV